MIFAILPILIIYERKLLAGCRPATDANRVGPFGLLQPIAETIK